MVTLSVFTPTFNRADLLPRGYQALCRQTSHDFCWLIIDDGSTDLTKDLVESWITSESIINTQDGFEGLSKDASWLHIRYCYKENGGLHTGYNKAIELMDTELCVCIDSDDYMPDDAVEIIVNEWSKCKDNGLIGIIGRDHYLDGRVIGGPLPHVKSAYIVELMDKFKHVGDKKIVMRVDLLKRIPPQPSYQGEKNFNPIYMMLQLDKFGKYLLLEKNLCFVDYQETGMAANIYKQYVNSANSFCALRNLYISLEHTTLEFRYKNLLQLVASAFIAKDLSWIRKCKYPIIAHLLVPIGFLLSKYIISKSNTRYNTNI